MVLLYWLGPFTIQTPQYNKTEGGDTLISYFKGYKFSVGKKIENSIWSYFRSNYRGLVPHPTLITRLHILEGVEGDWEEEKTCPRAPPLTLTGINKGPKNKGKEKEVETEE